MKKLTLLAVLFLSARAFPACGGYPTYFPLLCRGGLSMSFNDQTKKSPDKTWFIESVVVEGRFQKNPGAAYKIGKTLAVGTCAFEDRALRPDEPGNFVTGFGQMVPQYPPSARLFMASSIVTCNNNPNCVFSVCVQNKGRFFDAIPGLVDIHYPF